jgi:hypothetical protein
MGWGNRRRWQVQTNLCAPSARASCVASYLLPLQSSFLYLHPCPIQYDDRSQPRLAFPMTILPGQFSLPRFASSVNVLTLSPFNVAASGTPRLGVERVLVPPLPPSLQFPIMLVFTMALPLPVQPPLLSVLSTTRLQQFDSQSQP